MLKNPPKYDYHFYAGENGFYMKTKFTEEQLNMLSRNTCNTCWGKGFHTTSVNRHYFWNSVCKCVQNKLKRAMEPEPILEKKAFLDKFVKHTQEK